MKPAFAVIVGLLFFIPAVLLSQSANGPLTGLVTNEQDEILAGASLHWANRSAGTVTDSAGRFSLARPDSAALLIIRYIGYAEQQVEILPSENNVWIQLASSTQLQTTVVEGHSFGNSMSTLQTRNVESISSQELRKAPCCNLSESFQTNGAVDVTYSNALTGVKEIQMLGLRGIYSQFMVESRPTLGGIATPYAFEFIPGTWLNGIQLAKGASTVQNGFAGISGQINADLVKPQLDKPFFLNAFGSSEGRGEINVHLNKKGKENLHNGLLLHGNFVENRWDMNHDNFFDAPSRRQLNALYRSFYESEGWCGQLNVQGLTDHRFGGQITPVEGLERFAIDQTNNRLEVWAKLGRTGLGGRRYRELGNMISASRHESRADYGHNTYDARQTSVYWQTLYKTIIGNTNNTIIIAPSIQYDDIQETVNSSDLARREFVPGAMAEYTFSRPNLEMEMPDLTVVVGVRTDWNSRFGWLFTPRFSAKYNFSPTSILRLSGGRGYRSPNLAAENLGLLASNRQFRFAPGLGLEEAWNYGLNYTRNLKIAGRASSFNIDLYRTDFVRQIVVDQEQNFQEVRFYSLNGRSYSNSLLVSWQINLLAGLDVKLVYKYNDARITYADRGLLQLPFLAKHRGLVTVDYETPNKKWRFNTYLQLIGPQRLPDLSGVPHTYLHDFPKESPFYGLLNAQITYAPNKRLELYLGGENLTAYQQHHAIIASSDPWGPYFNASQVWAPIMGAVGFVGLRYGISPD